MNAAISCRGLVKRYGGVTAVDDLERRAVMNDGAPLAATLPELALMTVWGAGAFVIALRVFRWQ